jgi:hypothetical protein
MTYNLPMSTDADLPPELEALDTLLASQPQAVRNAFHYCLCLMMVETGKMRLVQTVASDTGSLCLFETVAGETFAIPKPALTERQQAELKMTLREILADEGML